MDVCLELRASHARGDPWGAAAADSGPATVGEASLEPLAPRLAAWGRAVKACRLLLGVDDVHRTSSKREREAEKTEKEDEEEAT